MGKPELYVSVDIETNGPIPVRNSMLSFGAAAYTEDANLIGTFEANLEEFPGAEGDEETMKWWATQPEAWARCRENLQDPAVAMTNFVKWVESFDTYSPVFVGYPTGFDFTWVHFYNTYFTGKDPFGFSALDIKSYAMATLGTSFRETVKRKMPKVWFDKKTKHEHVALSDAKEQGILFLNMRKANLTQK